MHGKKPNRLDPQRAKSTSHKAGIDQRVPVKCPFCSQVCKNGFVLKRHVKKIHYQLYE